MLGVGTASAALEALQRTTYDVVLLDLWLGAESGMELLPRILACQPDVGVVVITAFASFESAVEAIKRGAVDYLPKPFTPAQVRLAVQRLLESRRLQHRVSELEQRLAGIDVAPIFDSHSPRFRSFLDTVRRAADSNAVALLRGESGTGKNVLAQWMRGQSERRERPFVMVDCAALSPEFMSSTLFGSADAPGKVQEAEGGTLLLDEVADLGADAQARLLRFLHDQTYERLGEAQERRADVRLIATTNKPLEKLVQQGRFREDLLFRLNVLPLMVPPLRDRLEDVPLLTEHYLDFYGARQRRSGLRCTQQGMASLLGHDWPGNLRELRNVLERAAILSPAAALAPLDLGLSPAATTRVQIGAQLSLEDIEREHLAQVVASAPTLEAAARILGIDATTLGRKRKRYGLT
jgi:NtrC-family two-component system response regulator AlgB